MPREDIAQNGDVLDEGDLDGRDLELFGDERGGGGQGLALGNVGNDLDEEQCTAGADHVDRHTGKDDVGFEIEGEEAHEHTDQYAENERH